MHQYIYRINPVREEMIVAPTEQEARTIEQHFLYLQQLTQSASTSGYTLATTTNIWCSIIMVSATEISWRGIQPVGIYSAET